MKDFDRLWMILENYERFQKTVEDFGYLWKIPKDYVSF